MGSTAQNVYTWTGPYGYRSYTVKTVGGGRERSGGTAFSCGNSIAGNVFNDSNGNGAKDSGEGALTGSTVRLSNGQVRTVDTAGNYIFSGLGDGSYSVTLTPPSGYYSTTKNPVTVSYPNAGNITVNFGAVTGTFYSPKGHHDTSSCTVSTGWTCDPDNYTQPLTVRLYDGLANSTGSNFIGETTANAQRESAVAALCGGNAFHGYNFTTPESLKNNQTHAIHAYGINIGKGANSLLGSANITCAPTCTAATAPTGLSPNGIITPGLRNITWNPVAGATRYAIRVDDLSNPWASTTSCSSVNPGDVCTELTGTSISYTFQSGKAYDIWVHSVNNCGTYSPSAVAKATVPTPTPTSTPTPLPPTPTPTSTPTPTPTPTFTPTPTPIGGIMISGTVFVDTNGNGAKDTGEFGYASGLTISLSSGDDTRTNGSGNYSFTNLAPGTYIVTADPPSGYVDTTTNPKIVTVGPSSATVNFGINSIAEPTPTTAPVTYAISGNVFIDSNANGVKDIGEGLYQGAFIDLSNGDSAVSNPAGNYSFTSLNAGVYTVTMGIPEGYVETTTNPKLVSVGPNQTVNFGIQLATGGVSPSIAPSLFTISGFMFIDTNGNGTKDLGESLYQGAQIELSNGDRDFTSSAGTYQFFDLPAGTYTLIAAIPTDYIETTDNPTTVTIGPSKTSVHFGIKAVVVTPPVTPPCDSGEVCTECSGGGTNTCNNGNGTQTCTLTTHTSGGACIQSSRHNLICTHSNCLSGFACSNQQCVATDPTPTDGPTPTIAVGNTIFSVNIGLDGIGTTGDNASPNVSTGSNQNPLHSTRGISIETYNSSNQLVDTRPGSIIYNSNSGRFEGVVDMGSNLQTGNYIIKIRELGYLRRLVPGIQNITAGNPYSVPPVNLVVGDINGDNVLDIIDYNILISCSTFGTDNGAACNQNSVFRTHADLEDNGVVDQFDYNLFVREFSVQNGQ